MTLTQGVMGYWPLTEANATSRLDISGNNQTLVDGNPAFGAPAAVNQTPFNPNNNPAQQTLAANFLSPGNCVLSRGSPTDQVSLRWGVSDKGSICAWVYLTSPTVAGISRTIAGKYGVPVASSIYDYGLVYYGNAGGVSFDIGYGAGSGGVFSCNSGTLLQTNTWYFVVGRKLAFDTVQVLTLSAQDATLRKDWVTARFTTQGTRVSPSDSTFAIGTGWTGVTSGVALQSWAGAICGVGVWNRLLTDAEVGDLYNGGLGRIYPFTLTGVS